MATYSERRGDHKHKATYYDENGIEYKVYHDWDSSGKKVSTEIRTSGGNLVYKGPPLNNKGAKNKIYDKLGGDLQVFTSGELQTYRQQEKKDKEIKLEAEEKAEGFKEEFSEALDRSKQELKDVGESKKAEAIRLTGRQSSANQAAFRDVLLAQGRDVAEVDEIIQTGAESSQRNLTDILNKGAIATKDSVAKMNTLEIGSIATAEELGLRHKSLADTLMLNRQQLSQSWDIANLNAQTQLDVAEMGQPSGIEDLSGMITAGAKLYAATQGVPIP